MIDADEILPPALFQEIAHVVSIQRIMSVCIACVGKIFFLGNGLNTAVAIQPGSDVWSKEVL